VGAASVLAEELAQFGAQDVRERSHDVKFQGTLEVGYRACLWSRTATRVLLSLDRSMRAARRACTKPSSESTGGNILAQVRHWPATAAAVTNRSGTPSTVPSCSRTRSATICATPPANGRTSSPSGPTCYCICMSKDLRRCCPWISRARVCIGAATAPKAAARRSRRTSPPPCSCAQAGRPSVKGAARCSTPCAVPAPFSPKVP